MGLGTSSTYPRSRMPAPPQKSTTFIPHLPVFYLNTWPPSHRHDDAAALRSDALPRLHDCVLQVPRPEDHCVREQPCATPYISHNTGQRSRCDIWRVSVLNLLEFLVVSSSSVVAKSRLKL